MLPPIFPHDLGAKPKLLGERMVYDALRDGLNDMWSVFYDRPVRGTLRRVDFIAIDPGRGAVAIEVKGGLVHASRGAFRQLIAASGRREQINPFGQLKMAFARVCDVAGIDVLAVPLHLAIWLPQMAQTALTWEPSPHIWTRETVEGGGVGAMMGQMLPAQVSAAQGFALGQLTGALLRGGCERFAGHGGSADGRMRISR
jgi:Nuclease-related domain